GQSFLLQAKAYDSAGNLLSGDNDPITFSDSSGTLSGTPTSFTNGVAQTSRAQISNPYAGDQITAMSGSTIAMSPKFNVYGPLDHINMWFQRPVTAGDSFTLQAKAYDSAGNLLVGDNDPVSFSD